MVILSDLIQSVLTEYHKSHDLRMVPIRVDNLKPILQARGFVDRFIWEVFDFHSKNILAQVLCFKASTGAYAGEGDYARIQYSSALNFCWQRLVICKEMYHSLFDAPPENRITTNEQLLKLGELLVSQASAAVVDFKPFETESLSEIAALETLFPLELRIHHADAYDSGQVTDYQLALRYRIPEAYVRLAMYPSYRTTMMNIRNGKLVVL